MFHRQLVLRATRKDPKKEIERRYVLDFDEGSTLTEIIDVLCEMRSSCVQLLQEQTTQQAEHDKKVKEEIEKESPQEAQKEGE